MAALDAMRSGIRAVVVVLVTFATGSFVASVLGGVLAGVVTGLVGVVVPSMALLAIGPAGGLLAVGYAVQRGWVA